MTAPESRGSPHGVSAHGSVGTPFHLPAEAWASAAAALEYSDVLDLIAAGAAGPLGAERIRRRRPAADPGWIVEELAPVAELLALFGRGEKLDAVPVPELAPIAARLRLDGSVLEGPELVAVRQTLGAARQAAADLRRVAEAAPRAGALLVPVPEPRIEKRLADSLDDQGELLDTASPALFRARREVHAARDRLLKKLEAIIRALDPSGAAGGAAVTVRNGRYVIPVRRDLRRRPDGIVHDESASAGTLFLEPTGAVELGNALRSAVTEADREAVRVLRELTDLLRPVADTLEAAHAMCVALDDLVARTRYAREAGASVPAIRPPGAALVLRRARHPLLLARGVAVVPFDLVLDPDQHTLLVSGPNTGGKSVLLKTIGLAALLAQSGIVPPLAEGSELPVFPRFFADIGDHQSIAADLSTFSAHLATLRRVLTEAQPGALVLVDEIGSGTDPAEGAALAAAALVALTRRGVRTVATTHLGALKALGTQEPGIVNGSLQFDSERLAPTFHFQKGVPGRSYGLAIARRLGVLPEVLADAEARVSSAERSLDRLLEEAEARAQVLAARQLELESRAVAAEQEAARLAAQAEVQAARERELRARDREAERRAREQSRAFLLEARGQVEAALRKAAVATGDQEAKEARRLVEEGIRRAGEALAAGDHAAYDGVAPPDGAGLTPGQRVRLSSGGTGELVELRDDGRAVVIAGAIRLVVLPESLVPLPGRREDGEGKRPARSSVVAPPSVSEIDLRGLRGDEAAAVTVAALDAAAVADQPSLRIIHGMGTGVVRDRVHEVLKADRRVARFEFAPRNQGGTGVTVVELGP